MRIIPDTVDHDRASAPPLPPSKDPFEALTDGDMPARERVSAPLPWDVADTPR